MALSDFRKYIEINHPKTFVTVDLLKIGKSPETKDSCPPSSHIVIDGEWTLNRLYGGYLGDWICGGQWNRMMNFLGHLTSNLTKNKIEITVFFDGTSGPIRTKDWISKQVSVKKKLISVLRHLSSKGTQPPRNLWVPPNSLHTSLRLALRQLGVNVVVSLDDHRQEVMNFVREYRCRGVMSDDPEFVAFDPPRLFSSGSLKMTYNGRVSALEYIMDEIAKALGLERSRIPIVCSLLENHIMSAKDLFEFHRGLLGDNKRGGSNHSVIKAVVDFVRGLESVGDLELVSNLVFGNGKSEVKGKFEMSVRYYSLSDSPTAANSEMVSTVVSVRNPFGSNGSTMTDPTIGAEGALKFAEGAEASASSVETYHPAMISECDTNSLSRIFSYKCEVGSEYSSFVSDDSLATLGSDDFFVSPKPVAIVDAPRSVKRKLCSSTDTRSLLEALSSERPSVSVEVLKLARQRHRYGLMDPAIYRVLSTGEYLVPVGFEDVAGLELPCPGLFYRPLRQMVYSVLFDYHHKSNINDVAEPPPAIVVKEWIWRDSNKFVKAEPVHSRSLGWPVPSVSRLWFGTGPDDNNRRLRAFLSCMRSNNPRMWDTNHVSTRMIVLCSVLRYIVTNPDFPVLRKPELDAFLVQAVDPRRSCNASDVSDVEKLQLPSVNVRAVLLASLFMQGVESAVFANEACGSPVPYEVCSPSGYFDGKLFQETLFKSEACKNLVDLCGDRIHEVAMVERMRAAIVEDVQVPYCRLPAVMQQQQQKQPLLPAPPVVSHMQHLSYMNYSSSPFSADQFFMSPGWIQPPPPMQGSLTSLDATQPPRKQTRITNQRGNGSGRNVRFYPAGIGFAPSVRKAAPRQPRTNVGRVTTRAAAAVPNNNYTAYKSLGRGLSLETSVAKNENI